MIKHDEKILDMISKTIYETTILSKVNSGEYLRQLERVKNMIVMYADSHLEDYIDGIENPTSTDDNREDDKEGEI